MEIRRSYDRLISTMGCPILVRQHPYIESGPRLQRVKIIFPVIWPCVCHETRSPHFQPLPQHPLSIIVIQMIYSCWFSWWGSICPQFGVVDGLPGLTPGMTWKTWLSDQSWSSMTWMDNFVIFFVNWNEEILWTSLHWWQEQPSETFASVLSEFKPLSPDIMKAMHLAG